MLQGAELPTDLTEDAVLRYCANRLLQTGSSNISQTEEGAFLVGVSAIEQEAREGLGLTSFALSERARAQYNEAGGFVEVFLYTGAQRYDSGTVRLTAIEQPEQGTMNAKIEHHVLDETGQSQLVDQTATIRFWVDEAGQLHFVSASAQWVQDDLLSVSGPYFELDSETGALLSEAYNWEPIGGGLVACAYGVYDGGHGLAGLQLSVFDTNSLQLRHSSFLERDGFSTLIEVKGSPGQLIVKTDSSVYAFDETLALRQVIPLPSGVQLLDYSAYDVDDALSRLAYVTDQGVMISDLSGSSPRLLVAHSAPEGETDIYVAPRFVDGGSKLLLSRGGLGWNLGHLLCDLETNTATAYDEFLDVDSYYAIGDSALLMVGGYSTQDGAARRISGRVDFESGLFTEADLSELSERFLEFATSDEARYVYFFDVEDHSQSPLNASLSRVDLISGEIERSSLRVEGFDYIQLYWADERDLMFRAVYQGEERSCLVPLSSAFS